MRIHEIIKQKRLELKMTQEQVAERLGVSAPAVNKWERAISYPDITLLPPLARLLGVDLNTLLSFQEELTKEEVDQFVGELYAIIPEQGFDAVYEMGMKKLSEYPEVCFCHYPKVDAGMRLSLVYDGSYAARGCHDVCSIGV